MSRSASRSAAVRAVLAAGTLAAVLALAPPASAAPATVAFTPANDVFTARLDGSKVSRLTATTGGSDRFETHVSRSPASSSTLAYQSRLGAFRYTVMLRRGKKLSAPFAELQNRRRKRWFSFGAPAFSADGKRLAVVCFRDTNEVCIYDLKRKKLTQLTKCNCASEAGIPPRLSWSRNGRYIAFNSGWQQVRRLDVKRKRVELVYQVENGDTLGHVTISPDGGRIAFALEFLSPHPKGQPIRIVDLADRTSLDLFGPGEPGDEIGIGSVRGAFSAPSFSPDGRQLLVGFVGIGGDGTVAGFPPGIYVINADGSGTPQAVVQGEYDQINTAGLSTSWGS